MAPRWIRQSFKGQSYAITGASNITLEGLVLDGGVTLTDCTNVTLSDCTIGSGGVLVDGGSGVQIVHSTINTTGTGILITDGAVGTVIEHNQINGRHRESPSAAE